MQHSTESAQDPTVDKNTKKFLIFQLGEEHYATPLLSVKEIVEPHNYTPVPNCQPYFLGVTNLRGQILGLIDLRKKLGFQPENRVRMSYMVFDTESGLLAALVDEVLSVTTIKDEDIEKRVSGDAKARNFLLCELTNNTTYWFREPIQLRAFEDWVSDWHAHNSEKFKVWCSACSTGEEAYGIGLMLETYRRRHADFDYDILGLDIDPKVVNKAKKAIYSKRGLKDIPEKYHPLIRLGSGKTQDYFTLNREILKRSHFRTGDLNNLRENSKFDAIFCRNVLIYFSSGEVEAILSRLRDRLESHGILHLGQSEASEYQHIKLEPIGKSRYQKKVAFGAKPEPRTDEKGFPLPEKLVQPQPYTQSPIRLLMVDDDKVQTKLVSKILECPEIEILVAPSTAEADKFLQSEPIDVILLDWQLPDRQGPEWLKDIRNSGNKTPVIFSSSFSANQDKKVIEILENYAQEVFSKGRLAKESHIFKEQIFALARQVKNQEERLVVGIDEKQDIQSMDVIGIGASTGGPVVVPELLRRLSRDCPPILVTQHIDSHFADAYAERLAEKSSLARGTASHGAPLERGKLYVAPADTHLGVSYDRFSGHLKMLTSRHNNESGFKPSVGFLFDSLAKLDAGKVVAAGVLMTGMGTDGSSSLVNMKKQGHLTFCQDQSSCAIFGMPRVAIENGGAGFVGNPSQIANRLNMAMAHKKVA